MGTPHDEVDFSNSLVGRMGVSPTDKKVKIDVYMVTIRIGCLHVQRNLWQTFLGRDIPKMRQMLHNLGPKLFRIHIL